jgi:predicted acylesterase/phospholipase RssA
MPHDTPSEKSEKLGLALSGGGFRATLFHLGVVRALAEAGLLARITHITSVSGGSVLAAHLVLRWKDFALASDMFAEARSAPEPRATELAAAAAQRFDEAADPLLKFIESDVRADILRKLPWLFLGRGLCHVLKLCCVFFPDLCTRLDKIFQKRPAVESLRRHLERKLFGTKKLSELKSPHGPELAILATEVASMEHAWFTSEGFGQPSSVSGGGDSIGPNFFTIAQGVAASSAFPALFPPVRIDGKTTRSNESSTDSFVTDAGVYDNLGISGFHKEPFGKDGKEDYPVFVSDATATSDWSHDAEPGMLTNLFRSVDIMQQRAAQLQRESVALPQRDTRRGNAAAGLKAGRFLLFDIARGDIKSQPKVEDIIQRNVSYVRTDLDAFSPDEMRMLVHHGYSVAWHSLAEAKSLPQAVSRFAVWQEYWPRRARLNSLDELNDELERSTRSRVKFFRLSEPLGAANALVACLLILAPIVISKVQTDYRKRQETEQKAEERIERVRRRIESYETFTFEESATALPKNTGTAPPDPGYAGVRLKSFEKTFDLRQWQPVDKALIQKEAREAAWQQTVYTINRTDAAAEKIRFKLRTSGFGIDPYVPTLKTEVFQTIEKGERLSKTIDMDIDLRPIPQGYDYPIFVRGRFWNAFQKEIETAGFKVYVADGEIGALLVIFPKNRLPNRFNFRHEAATHEVATLSPKPFHVVYQNGIYFEVERPQLNSTYTLVFTWTDGETGPKETTLPTYDPNLLPAEASANTPAPSVRPLMNSPSKPENRL